MLREAAVRRNAAEAIGAAQFSTEILRQVDRYARDLNAARQSVFRDSRILAKADLAAAMDHCGGAVVITEANVATEKVNE